MKYGSYEILASFYDGLNSDIDYGEWSMFIKKIFEKYGMIDTKLVLDLACGTGMMTVQLAKMGYEMIGIDLSPEMLNEANNRAFNERQSILFLNQNMCEIDLYGTVDATVCCLDSLNYLTTDKELCKCFSLVNNFMNDGGLFVFDINTPHKFKNVYGNNAYILENENVLCAWQNTFDEESDICDFDLTFFAENADGTYDRFDEHQCEKMYTDESMRKHLENNGFEVLGVFSDFNFTEYKDTDERWYYVCRVHNKNK